MPASQTRTRRMRHRRARWMDSIIYDSTSRSTPRTKARGICNLDRSEEESNLRTTTNTAVCCIPRLCRDLSPLPMKLPRNPPPLRPHYLRNSRSVSREHSHNNCSAGMVCS